MQFDDLTPGGRVALAAWAVLAKSFASDADELVEFLSEFPTEYVPAAGDICKAAGMRQRRMHNNMRRTDVTPQSIRNKKFTPGNQRRRPAKRKATV